MIRAILILAIPLTMAADAPSLLPPDLVGPVAGLVFAVGAATLLWREHVRTDHDRVDDLRSTRDIAIEGWRAQTDATRDVTATLKVVTGELAEIKETLARERAGSRTSRR